MELWFVDSSAAPVSPIVKTHDNGFLQSSEHPCLLCAHTSNLNDFEEFVVKKRIVIFAACLIPVILACETREPVNKEPKKLDKASYKVENAESRFMESETDPFHPRSLIESARKERLTNFGRLDREQPSLLPDMEAAGELINKPGMDPAQVSLMAFVPLVIPSFPFDYENDVAALERLYNEHDLDSIINRDLSDMEKMINLLRYTYDFLDGGTAPSPDQSFPSAFVITRQRKNDGIGGTSEHYAALFCQLVLSCGYSARLMGMHKLDESGQPLSNTICEVFMRGYHKWVAFDPYHEATYYLRDDIPQSALELREIMLDDLYHDITPVSIRGDFTDVVNVREKLLPRCRYLYMWRMNNILGSSGRTSSISWEDLYRAHLVWEDEFSLVSEGGFDKIPAFENGVRFVAHDEQDFYWNLNTVAVRIDRIENEKLKLTIDTITPNFDHFNLRVETDRGFRQLKPVKGNTTIVNELFVDILVRSINAFDHGGPVAHLVVGAP